MSSYSTRRTFFAFVATLAFGLASAAAQDARRTYVPPALDTVHAVPSEHGMVVAQEKISAQVGADILRRGGNAVDAAVATGFAMAVTYPRAGNIGGGGFMVIHSAERNEDITIDYRETAPAATTPQIFLGADGKPDAAKSRDSALGVGVPGTVAGLALALEKYGSGRFTLAQLLEPAIGLARDGFVVTDDIADTLPGWHRRLARWPSSAKIFSRPDGTALGEGDRLVQSDLAETLSAVAAQGPRGFYEGPVADKLAKAVADAGGIMTPADLKSYSAVIRAPVHGTYRGYDIVSMPLPSSGGVVLVETLNILEGFQLADLKQGSPASLHLLIEAMKRAYADRARYLGDPAFVNAPIETLTAKDYAAKLRAGISTERATPSKQLISAPPAPREGTNTTHFSVVDAGGNAVSNTYTLNFSYGVGLIADGTGVLLNNELDDFTAAVGASNAYGLVGFEPNLPGPGKRPLSSMSPTIVLKDGKPVLVTGSPGGSRIISTVLQVIVNVLDYKMDVAAAVAAPRLHHQWLPDEVRVESGFPGDVLVELKAMDHLIVEPMGQTSANSILVTPNGPLGAPDPRTRGAEAAGQ
ncbi:gamma-glutamyltranspeptidase [Bradyrhizobium japonicum]|uniref:Glutathione hydrolase proenzyme n=1 Tax=Bradyrhizobium japonicum TaxID=375 RepID=A0A0A3XX98_BRAJP|nr:gamma-glutamyltransferase [Bradyrhizobium japonicum]KGT77816.1 gamma-glutamyltranspeptidase [Bradyrhizobium japonicum]MCS3891470.1 gamma-glutamyltranspeptidase/glutathione hydrolase [Bradyrhizobium japonicum USDA 38]MCS3943986.1 gamma-glutamyltranspeptidase/glutathione hydrolase [Bradyrhizobium japonicum]MCW2223318.1 gamma-glutamyltranspeptidase/glutathione hydrolase [Bradyrhizobium japonicum]MCW2347930.1 gamma-glutamyltranspeptidase/glutathione hydrolase [Bradyrhizobium japonicum]